MSVFTGKEAVSTLDRLSVVPEKMAQILLFIYLFFITTTKHKVIQSLLGGISTIKQMRK